MSPNALNAQYYGQRATPGGLIIAEASQVLPCGQGMPATPGIHSREQVEGWKGVVRAIHARGGRVFLQLWHVGRISHSSNQPGGALPIAPSAVAAQGNAMTATFAREPFETPRALRLDEIPGIVEGYAQAARNALAAGLRRRRGARRQRLPARAVPAEPHQPSHRSPMAARSPTARG